MKFHEKPNSFIINETYFEKIGKGVDLCNVLKDFVFENIRFVMVGIFSIG